MTAGGEPEPPRGGTEVDPADQPTDSPLEEFVRDGAKLSRSDREQLAKMLADNGVGFFRSGDIARHFDDLTTAADRRAVIRTVQSGRIVDLPGDEQGDRFSQAMDVMQSHGMQYMADSGRKRSDVLDWLEQVHRVDPQRRRDVLDALSRGEEPELGKGAREVYEDAQRVAPQLGNTSLYLHRTADGNVHMSTERPDGQHYEVLPGSGQVMAVSASGTRRAVADGDTGKQAVIDTLGGKARKLTGQARADAQPTPMPSDVKAPLTNWDALPSDVQERAGRVFQAIDRLHRLDGMPPIELAPIRDGYSNSRIDQKPAGEMSIRFVHGGMDSYGDHTDGRDEFSRNVLKMSDSMGPDQAGNVMAHEYGHAIDFIGLGDAGLNERRSGTMQAAENESFDPDDFTPQQAAVKRWLSEVTMSPTMEKIRRNAAEVPKSLGYLTSAEEMWARAYAQWVMRYGGDERLRQDLRRMQRQAEGPDTLPHVWEDDEFEPIARAIEAVMVAKGWRDE